jgi:DNA-binding beta-propeller fold protein YncE
MGARFPHRSRAGSVRRLGPRLAAAAVFFSVSLVALAEGTAGREEGHPAPLFERSAAQAETGAMVWPPAPATPRIRYLRTISGPSDLQARSGRVGLLLRRILFGEEEEGFVRPYGVAAVDGKVFVADPGLAAVHVFDLAARRYSRLKDRKRDPLISPIGVAAAADGDLLVTDSQAGKVLVFDHSNRLKFSFGTREELQRPTGIACAGDRVYVVDTLGHRVLVYTKSERSVRLEFEFGGRGTEAGRFNFPVDAAVGSSGRLYVNDSMNFRVQVFEPDGTFVQTLGGPGDSSGHFQRSKGIGLDSDENLYVVDALADTVQIFDGQGRFLLSFGAPGRSAGEFWLPSGMAVDGEDVLYVADSYNRRLQIFQYVKENRDDGP